MRQTEIPLSDSASDSDAHNHRYLPLACLLSALCLGFASQCFAQNALPTEEQALKAYRTFMQDPASRLDQTQPFLVFIRDSGAVHMLLNDGLLAWMHDTTIADKNKAVLYAAYLGANMEAQLSRGETGSDNVAAMKGVLQAYSHLRKTTPDLTIALLDQLAAYATETELAAAVNAIALGETPPSPR